MQPTEHKQPTEEELIAHIRQSLMAHEETYEVGAWEKFNKQETKKHPFLWIKVLSAAAAVLVVCFGLFLITKEKPAELKNTVIKTNSSALGKQPENTIAKSLPTTDGMQKEPIVENFSANRNDHALVADITPTPKQDQTFVESTVVVATPANVNHPSNQQAAVNTINENPIGINGASPKTDPQQAEIIAGEKPKPNIMDFLNKETEKDKAKAQGNVLDKRANRWELGLMVAPSFGNTKKLNMGYGVSMEYSLSDKLSLSSGIAYNEMTASKSVGSNGLAASPSTSAFAKDSRSLEAVSERVIGLDIPLELKYHISNSVYANFGVSAFAVLDYQRNNTYLENKLVPNYSSVGGVNNPNSPTTGPTDETASFVNSMFVNQRTTEPAPESNKKESNYIGFYNLSVGYKKKISKNNSMSIEPFLKLPMKEVSKDNLKLIGTGLRLKFDF